MINKLGTIFKKCIIWIITGFFVLSATYTMIPVAKAASSSILGTNAALGSPILNSEFTADNWNKWELVCWGVFLSNFVQPLCDTYESAFQSGAGGSNGAGYQALQFSTGNDSENSEVIRDFCTYAITVEKSVRKQIYMNTTDAMDISSQENPNSSDEVKNKLRPATFHDLLLNGEKIEYESNPDGKGRPFVKIEGVHGDYDTSGANQKGVISDGLLPTFYVEANNGNDYVKVFDYCDPWDIQIFAAIINSRGDQHNSEVFDAIEELAEADEPIYFDAFGNIVTSDDRMIIPASANQHLTGENNESINILNNFVFSNYPTTYSDEGYLMRIASRDTVWTDFNVAEGKQNMPAVAVSKTGTISLLYYDMDSMIDTDTDHYGNALLELFQQDINSENQKYPLMLGVTGFDTDKVFFNNLQYKSTPTGKGGSVTQTVAAASIFANTVGQQDGVTFKNKPILHEIIYPSGDKIALFDSDPIIIKPTTDFYEDAATQDGKRSNKIWRYLENYMYQVYKGKLKNTAGTNISRDDIIKYIEGSKNYFTAGEFATGGEEDFINGLNHGKRGEYIWDAFFKTYKADLGISDKESTGYDDGILDFIQAYKPTNYGGKTIALYPVSKMMQRIGQTLHLQQGTNFAQNAPYIYMTYLDWYGVVNNQDALYGKQRTSKFDPLLFDENSDVVPEDVTAVMSDAMSADEKKNEVLNLSYLMLSPEKGREYRKEMMYNTIEDWFFEQYNRVCYGGSGNYNGVTSKAQNGVFSIPYYDENPLTSWFLDAYANIAIVAVLVCVIACIIIAIIQHRKFSWFVITVLITVNGFLIVPAFGDIVPIITNASVQSMFSRHTQNLSINEALTNSALEDEAARASNKLQSDGELSQADAEAVNRIVKQLSLVYIDRTLMIKQDISQKLTQKLGGVYADIQSIQSARWLLPVVMQQFTADDKNDKYDYLYTKLGFMWDDMSNFYWYYQPDDGLNMIPYTATSSQNTEKNADTDGYSAKLKDQSFGGLFSDVRTRDTMMNELVGTGGDTVNYHSYSYTGPQADDLTHLYSYLYLGQPDVYPLPRSGALGASAENYVDAESWQEYIDLAKGSQSETSWMSTTEFSGWDGMTLEQVLQSYDRTDRDTVQGCFSYFKMTETPAYYFYDVIKDTFDQSITDQAGTGILVGRLVGTIEENADGEAVRSNFMYATKGLEDGDTWNKAHRDDIEYTGWSRDVLDLENLFNNVIPYMYQMQVTAGGFDTKSGILTDAQLGYDEPLLISKESNFYEGMPQGWLYRCNWATKIMENPEWAKGVKVYDAAGTEYTVTNPILYEAYPSNRPMVFSEAQRMAMGLEEKDLNIVELKCIEANKKASQKWTLLINYASQSGITKEVLMRQMAIDATTEFNKQFSSGGLINNSFELYPQTIDLRYISFDSVMKIIMTGVSQNSSYTYGNTMSTFIGEQSLGAIFLLWADAAISSSLIPFLRAIFMAVLIILNIIAIIRVIFGDTKAKARVACGQVITCAIFIIATLIYYAIFLGMMSLSSSDQLLQESSKTFVIKSGNVIWPLFIIFAISLAYAIFVFGFIIFIAKNWRDMGFERYAVMGAAIAGSMGKLGHKIKDGFNSLKGGVQTNTESNRIAAKDMHDAISDNAPAGEKGTSEAYIESHTSSKEERDRYDSEHSQERYSDDVYSESNMTNNRDSQTSTTEINREIEKGRKVDIEEHHVTTEQVMHDEANKAERRDS